MPVCQPRCCTKWYPQAPSVQLRALSQEHANVVPNSCGLLRTGGGQRLPSVFPSLKATIPVTPRVWPHKTRSCAPASASHMTAV